MALSPLQKFTDVLSGEDYATVSYVKPEMASLVDPRFRATYIANKKIKGVKCRAVSEAEALLADPPVVKKEKQTHRSFLTTPSQR